MNNPLKFLKKKRDDLIQLFKIHFNYKHIIIRIILAILISVIILALLFKPYVTYCRNDNAILNSQTTNILLSDIKNEMLESSFQLFFSFPFEYKNYDLILRNVNTRINNPSVEKEMWITFILDNKSYNVYVGKDLRIRDVPLQEEHNAYFSNFNTGKIGGDYVKYTNKGGYLSIEGPNLPEIKWSYEICISRSQTETTYKFILIFIVVLFILPSVKSFIKFWIGSRDY